jgi:hypothetical protein
MGHARRFIATLIGCTAWCMLSATVASPLCCTIRSQPLQSSFPRGAQPLEHRFGTLQPLQSLGFSWFLP